MRALVFTLALLTLCACSLSGIRTVSTEERLQSFPTSGLPLQGAARVYWSKEQIPFIDAEHDLDGAFVLGLVHAHLRLGQMELLRRISQGTTAELLGPFFFSALDESLRTLNFARATPEIVRTLPPATRSWLERYVAGINLYLERVKTLPPDLALVTSRITPWSIEDVVTLSRLAATDVNWLFWYSLLSLRSEPSWSEFFEHLRNQGLASLPSYGEESPLNLLSPIVRSGSNCFSVGSARTGGAAILGTDPHLGLMLPNTWVVAGLRTPSYHLTGLSVPGIPAFLVGRNTEIAWGGTNMMSFSSSLYDASNLPATTRSETIARRWWLDRRVEISETEFGPVITRSPLLREFSPHPLALKWRGHEPSDELTTFLSLGRATSWEDFRRAFSGYAVSGQNFLYADRQGNIGQLAAVEFAPAAGKTALELVGDPTRDEHRWTLRLTPHDLPTVYNPAEGFLVSANNPPVRTSPPLSMFSSANDRLTRLRELLTDHTPFTAADAKRAQLDVFARSSKELAQRIAAAALTEGAFAPEQALVLSALTNWDGEYTVESTGAVAFQRVVYHLVKSLYEKRYGTKAAEYLLGSQSVYSLALLDPTTSDAAHAVREAAHGYDPELRWGDLHRVALTHPFSRLPLFGKRFRFGDFPSGGSSTSLYKSAHALTTEKHNTRYGANSRFIADLSDLDANSVVLLGGQDGWVGSANFLDQLDLFRRGGYVALPLRLETVARTYPHKLELRR